MSLIKNKHQHTAAATVIITILPTIKRARAVAVGVVVKVWIVFVCVWREGVVVEGTTLTLSVSFSTMSCL